MHWGRTRSEGSEHYIEGKQYAAEMHFVHYNTRYANLSEAMDAQAKSDDALIIVAQVLDSVHVKTRVSFCGRWSMEGEGVLWKERVFCGKRTCKDKSIVHQSLSLMRDAIIFRP